jgi:hypothetical protein
MVQAVIIESSINDNYSFPGGQEHENRKYHRKKEESWTSNSSPGRGFLEFNLSLSSFTCESRH